jgi:hypothetical protein
MHASMILIISMYIDIVTKHTGKRIFGTKWDLITNATSKYLEFFLLFNSFTGSKQSSINSWLLSQEILLTVKSTNSYLYF